MLNKLLNKNWVIVFAIALMLVVIKLIDLPDDVLSWDVFGYYLYLPAQFIYHDLALQDHAWLNHIRETYEPSSTLYQLVHLENGSRVIKYTNGLAVLLLPFFFLAHWIAEPLGFAADGFSLPYQYSMTAGAMVYAVIGVWFAIKILRHFFTPVVSVITLLLIVLATNYFQLTAYDGILLSHNFLFTFYAILIFYTIRWYEFKDFKSVIWIGVSLGFITLIRPSEIVAVLIPLLWFDGKGPYLKSKINLVKNHFGDMLVIGILIVLIFSFQMVYWKIITGDFLFYSYTNAGEGLDFASPHTFKFLFSFRKGWLIYTPLVLFAVWGWLLMIKQKQYLWISVLVFYILHVYIASSWTTWWYAGGSFSSRSMMPTYVFLMIPLGYLITYIIQSKGALKWFVSVCIAFVLWLNIFQTWQFNNRIIDRGRMTKAYYMKIFGKTSATEEDRELLMVWRSNESIERFTDSTGYNPTVIYNENWSDTTENGTSFSLDKDHIFLEGVNLKFHELTQKDHVWIVAESRVFIPNDYEGLYPELIVTFNHKDKVYKYRSTQFESHILKVGEWNNMRIEYLTPEVRSIDDNVKVYLWHRGNSDVPVKGLRITTYEKVD